jgi:uncharacterized protein (DUF924 family)
VIASPKAVLEFWRKAGPKKWFAKSAAFDRHIRVRFLPTYNAAAAGALSHWERTAEGALALAIVLDQFPRNMFRNSARAFAADHLARGVARRAIARGYDRIVPRDQRTFFYLPFEHSESMADQERCVALFRATGNAELVKWAVVHADIIRRFGRFPHRNAALGRRTTTAERAFLAAGGFSG